MAIVVHYDSSQIPNWLTDFVLSGDGPNNEGKPNTLVFDDNPPSEIPIYNAVRELLTTKDIRDLKHEGGTVVEATFSEKTARFGIEDFQRNLEIRANAKSLIDGFNAVPVILRYAEQIRLNHINNQLAQKLTNLLSWLGTQTSLINRPQLNAMIPTQPTLDEFKTAIKNAIDAGGSNDEK